MATDDLRRRVDDPAFAATRPATQGDGGVAGEPFDPGGRYVLERLLGTGGMGAAWLARDTTLLRRCVLKVLHKAAWTDGSLSARFLREARLTARLRHPNIVTTYDFGVSDAGVPFLVLEELEGTSLEALLETAGPLPLVRVVAIGVQILRALEAAHEASVVHHDIKPANVFVQKNGVVKLLDFGVAAFVDPSGKTAGSALGPGTPAGGTPYYMAPEQFEATKASDPRSDLWALGVLLYEARTGAVPFASDSLPTLIGKILSIDPPLPAGRDHGERELWSVVKRALAKSPDARFADARAMAAPLDALWDSLSRRAGVTVERSANGVLPTPVVDDDVTFTVYRPNTVPPGEWVKIAAFAHRALDASERGRLSYDDPVAEVERRAAEVLGAMDQHGAERASPSGGIPREHELTFAPSAPGVTFEPATRTFTWSSPVHREVFLARVDDGRAPEIQAHLRVFLGALLLAEVRFVLTVGAPVMARPDVAAHARPFAHVFVSYANEDAAVAAQVKALSAALTGTRFLEASLTERATQTLGAEGQRAIESAEAIQVLWSEHALGSSLVDAELRHALARRGAAAVRPVCWELPPPTDPARDRPPSAIRSLAFTALAAPANALLVAALTGLVGIAETAPMMPPLAAPAPVPPPPVAAPLPGAGFGYVPAPTAFSAYAAVEPRPADDGSPPSKRGGRGRWIATLTGVASLAIVAMLFLRTTRSAELPPTIAQGSPTLSATRVAPISEQPTTATNRPHVTVAEVDAGKPTDAGKPSDAGSAAKRLRP